VRGPPEIVLDTCCHGVLSKALQELFSRVPLIFRLVMPYLLVELVLQLVERNDVFYLVSHRRIARTRRNSHLIAQVDQLLEPPRRVLWVVKRQYRV